MRPPFDKLKASRAGRGTAGQARRGSTGGMCDRGATPPGRLVSQPKRSEAGTAGARSVRSEHRMAQGYLTAKKSNVSRPNAGQSRGGGGGGGAPPVVRHSSIRGDRQTPVKRDYRDGVIETLADSEHGLARQVAAQLTLCKGREPCGDNIAAVSSGPRGFRPHLPVSPTSELRRLSAPLRAPTATPLTLRTLTTTSMCL